MNPELKKLAEGMLERLRRLPEQPERMAEVEAAFRQVVERCAEICDERAEMRDRYECDCRGYTRAAEHNAEGIRALISEDQ